MKFQDLLTRCDIEILQRFLGDDCMRLLSLLDTKMSSPTFLRRLVVESIGQESLLLKPDARAEILPLLKQKEAQELCQALGFDFGADPYQAIRQCAIDRGSTREKALFDYFELPTPPVESIQVPPQITAVNGSYPLFSHQRNAAHKVSEYLQNPPYRVLLHMPTGAGKTRTAMNVICDHLRFREPTVVLWVAHSEELCDQAADEFLRAWSQSGNRELQLRRFWGHHQFDLGEFKDGIIIAGIPKMLRLADRSFVQIGALGARCSLVIIDEAHQAVAPEYKRILEAVLAHHSDTALLGLSATPGRTWNDVAADEDLSKFFSRRKVGLDIPGYPNPVDFLVEKGYLAKAEFKSLLYGGGFKPTGMDLQDLERSLDVSETLLKRLGEDDQRNLTIVSQLEQLLIRHTRIIVFAASVDHAHLLATVLTARGFNASAVTTRTSQIERSRKIDEFKSETPPPIVLCNYGVLTTGFDAPRTSCALIARPTKSLVLYSQMVGRAIRGPKAGGNATAQIVTVVDQNLPGFGTVADAFTNWEDIWTLPPN